MNQLDEEEHASHEIFSAVKELGDDLSAVNLTNLDPTKSVD